MRPLLRYHKSNHPSKYDVQFLIQGRSASSEPLDNYRFWNPPHPVLPVLLTRLGYIALLVYWYIYISQNFVLFPQIFFELSRSKWAASGETNSLGKHWTLNIADHIVLAVFNQLFTFLLPHDFWALISVNCLLLMFLSYHIVHLWMQTQIARLARLNTDVWRWRDWVIDSTFLSLMQTIDSSGTRAFAKGMFVDRASGCCRLHSRCCNQSVANLLHLTTALTFESVHQVYDEVIQVPNILPILVPRPWKVRQSESARAQVQSPEESRGYPSHPAISSFWVCKDIL
jgi:hypothetical protein